MTDWLNRVHFGDCLETLRRMPDPFALLLAPPVPPEWTGPKRIHLLEDEDMEPEPEAELRRRLQYAEKNRIATLKRLATRAQKAQLRPDLPPVARGRWVERAYVPPGYRMEYAPGGVAQVPLGNGKRVTVCVVLPRVHLNPVKAPPPAKTKKKTKRGKRCAQPA